MFDVVKEGWLKKRGEYIRNWRQRYFILCSNGSFMGFKYKIGEYRSKRFNNCFSIKKCEIMCQSSQSRQYVFIIRCFQLEKCVKRTFAASSINEREEWISAIENVSQCIFMENNCNLFKTTLTCSTDLIYGATLKDFKFLKVLGTGAFGKVVLGKEMKTGNVFAIKILRKELILDKDEVEHTLTENRVLQKTKHPFLTELIYSYQTKYHLIFVMEYIAGGELLFHLSRDKVFSENRARFYGAEITLALMHLHKNKIIYRDLKLENILIDSDGHIKITDFGLCKEEISYTDTTKTFCGTHEYLAPEVLKGNDYGLAVDWWCFGVVLHEMLCGRLPLRNSDHEVLFEHKTNEPDLFPYKLSVSSISILCGLLKKCPEKRLGGGIRDAEEVMSHEFFNDINWNDVLNKKVDAPFKPILVNKEDVKYFEEDFTDQPLPPSFTLQKKCKEKWFLTSSKSLNTDLDEVFSEFTFIGKEELK